MLPEISRYLIRHYPLQLLALGVGLLMTFQPGNQVQSAWIWSFTLFSVYMMCALAYLFIKTVADLERLSTIFIVICVVIATTAVMAYAGFADGVIILSDNTPLNPDDDAVVYSRTYGISYSNTVNGFTPISLIFLYSKKWPKAIKVILFAVIAASVFISLKRLAYISLILSLLYIIFREGKRPQWKLLLLFSLLTASGIFFFGHTIVERFQDTGNALSGEQSPDNTRTILIEYGWKQFMKSPFLGSGSGRVIYVHNGYLEILVNLGLMGLLILVPWVYKPMRSFFRHHHYRQRDWAAGCLIYLVTLFLFEAVLNRLDLFWIFGLLLAGFECARRLEEVGDKNKAIWRKDKLALQ
ncbi:O-antigen ligase [Flavitalea sp. BT771]|uniref:O-antigen ligase family protein n=1 Tax=Flavitalea sp. BT771 TaxID=3063329 RepID=UPI0026E3E046|nr:O-antigen ligase family protein [Flavitalea sp. BT771]MDV6218465.1 O-antigen ligase family protein [Flavitalea sp. BT771]